MPICRWLSLGWSCQLQTGILKPAEVRHIRGCDRRVIRESRGGDHTIAQRSRRRPVSLNRRAATSACPAVRSRHCPTIWAAMSSSDLESGPQRNSAQATALMVRLSPDATQSRIFPSSGLPPRSARMTKLVSRWIIGALNSLLSSRAPLLPNVTCPLIEVHVALAHGRLQTIERIESRDVARIVSRCRDTDGAPEHLGFRHLPTACQFLQCSDGPDIQRVGRFDSCYGHKSILRP